MKEISQKDKLRFEGVEKLIRGFAIPATIALLINSLYNIVDAMFVGRAVGTVGIGALGIVFPLQIIILSFAQLIAVGAGSMISRKLGSNDLKKVKNISANSILLNTIITVILVAVGFIFTKEILVAMGSTDTLLPYSTQYLNIILIGVIFFTTSTVLSSTTRAEGNINMGVIAMMTGAILNIALDPIFIFLLDMGIQGAATATIISQFVSFMILVRFIIKKDSNLKFAFSNLKPQVSIIKETILIGLSSFIRMIIGSVVIVLINNLLNQYGGDIYISVYGTITRILTFVLMPIFGLIQGLQPVVGFNFGSNNKDRVIRAINFSQKNAFIIGLVVSAFVWIFASSIMKAFSSNQDFYLNGTTAIRIIFIAVPIVSIQMIASGVFQATGKAMHALILAILRQLLLIPFIIILPTINDLGIIGIWIAFPISDTLASIITMIIMYGYKKELSTKETLAIAT